MFRCATVNVKKLLRTVEHKLYYHCAIALPAKVVEFLNAQPTHSMRTECSTTSYPSIPAYLKGLFRVPFLLPGFNLISPVFVTPLSLNFLILFSSTLLPKTLDPVFSLKSFASNHFPWFFFPCYLLL